MKLKSLESFLSAQQSDYHQIMDEGAEEVKDDLADSSSDDEIKVPPKNLRNSRHL